MVWAGLTGIPGGKIALLGYKGWILEPPPVLSCWLREAAQEPMGGSQSPCFPQQPSWWDLIGHLHRHSADSYSQEPGFATHGVLPAGQKEDEWRHRCSNPREELGTFTYLVFPEHQPCDACTS